MEDSKLIFYTEIFIAAVLATIFVKFIFPILLKVVVWVFLFVVILAAIDYLAENFGGKKWEWK
jgi:hypothetical protein